jgi:hypothetical protein
MLTFIALVGCAEDQQPSTAPLPDAAAKPRPSVALRVLVVNEPELAEAIERLRSEWAERFGGSLAAVSKPWPELAAADSLDADLILFPSRYLGELGTRQWIRPVRSNVLDDPSFNTDDVFPLVHRRLITWGGQVMALPLGVDPGTVTESLDRRPAVDWLLTVAPVVVSVDRAGVLFDPQTMEPRITEPPFVAALERLRDAQADNNSAAASTVGRVPVLGVDDRLAAVTTSSRNAATAFKLLGWLAGPEISLQLARSGRRTLPVRRSLATSPAWYDASVSASARHDLGTALAQSLGGDRCLVVPRIPGLDEYLAAIDRAIENAVNRTTEPQAALEEAAAEWERITTAHGREAQREAYRKHLGIDKP